MFTEQSKRRAVELGVADRIEFIHGDAAGYVSDEKASVAACVGATWIGGGVAGTIELLARSLRTGGIILIGEPYWRQLPPTEEVAKRCLANSISDFHMLPALLALFELANEVRAQLTSEPERYAAYTREYLGWGVSDGKSLMRRSVRPETLLFGGPSGSTMQRVLSLEILRLSDAPCFKPRSQQRKRIRPAQYSPNQAAGGN